MSSLEKGVTIFLGGLITIAVAYTLTAKTAKTSTVVNSFGGFTSGSISAAEGRAS
jgi:hypothetical protein